MAYPHVVAAITDEELANALRVNFESEKVAAEVHRLHWFAMEVVGRVAPGAPVVIVNEAIIRLAGYLFDQPGATRGVGVRKRAPKQRGRSHFALLPRAPRRQHMRHTNRRRERR